MPRIAVGLEYDGTAYAGWQIQAASIPSVQAAVERAFGAVADHPVAIVCAGRTDTGVHAVEQVAHFDTTAMRSERSWTFGANTNLPNDVCALWAREVPDHFHARYSATERAYRYVILHRSSRPALQRKRVCWSHKRLDAARMDAAAAHLIGTHDFSAFRSSECQSRTPVRHLRSIQIRACGDYLLIDVHANAFLHHMVRNIAGVLMKIAGGEAEPGWAKEVLEGRDRTLGGVTAPAGGLYLLKVTYPPEYGLPQAEADVAQDVSFIIPRATP
jgi:tRNA pseudouridine38-40 synthase